MTEPASAQELFRGRHFDQEIIVLCVRWYLTFKPLPPEAEPFKFAPEPPQPARTGSSAFQSPARTAAPIAGWSYERTPCPAGSRAFQNRTDSTRSGGALLDNRRENEPRNRNHPGRFSRHREETRGESLCQTWGTNPDL